MFDQIRANIMLKQYLILLNIMFSGSGFPHGKWESVFQSGTSGNFDFS